jgi:hypothetical protein
MKLISFFSALNAEDQMCGGSHKGMLCHVLWRVITTLKFSFCAVFSEAGRKSKKLFSISKLSMKNFFIFYSASEAAGIRWAVGLY